MRYRALIVALLALCFGLLTGCGDAQVSSAPNRDTITYDQILNTGLANKCPQLGETARDAIPVQANQSYLVSDLCLEPQDYYVKEEPENSRAKAEFIQGKVLTRSTSSLEQIRGSLKVDDNGVLTFKEKDGLDFQPITVQLPGGERVAFMFTIKELVASSEKGLTSINTSTDFQGKFIVPSYRGNVFLDPKGRGVASGYDNAVALPSLADAEEISRANVKRLDKGEGKIALEITKVDKDTGEIAGIFVSEQPSDTDLGAEEPKEVRIRGIFYGRLEPVQA